MKARMTVAQVPISDDMVDDSQKLSIFLETAASHPVFINDAVTTRSSMLSYASMVWVRVGEGYP